MIPRMTLRLRMILLFCAVVGVLLAGIYMVVYSMFSTGVENTRFDRLGNRGQPLAALLGYPGGRQLVENLDLRKQYFEVFDTAGNVLSKSKSLGGADLPHPVFGPRDRTQFATVSSAFGSVREVAIPIQLDGRDAWFIVSEPTSTISLIEAGFRSRFILIWTGIMGLTALLATWYVARSLRPIVVLTQHAEELTYRISGVGEYDTTPKLPVRNPYDEVGRLAMNFNVLFERVDSLVRQLRLFVSDAAHELRTPLSVLRGETQLLLAQPRPVAEYERALRIIDVELATMGRIIEGLFTLSMADAGQLNIQRDQLYLDEVLEEACGMAAPLAREKGIAIRKQRWQEEEFRGDQTMLRQLFLILLENAVKYSPSNTAITVDLQTLSGRPTAIIEDQGIGISPQDLPHIFKRFYRAAPQTSDGSRSGGLGLAIADAIAKAHHGSISCESRAGQGSRFTVSFARPEARALKTLSESIPALRDG